MSSLISPPKSSVRVSGRRRTPASVGSSETMARQSYILLEEMILTLELKPGTMLNERALIARTGFGRTPLREAIQRLARERLVRVLPRKGVVVAEINIADFFSLLETRRVLDGLIAEQAAVRSTTEQRNQLWDLARRMESAAKKNQLREFMRLDKECDTLIEDACKNSFAVRAVEPLHAHCRRFWYRYIHAGDLVKASRMHTALLHAIAAGDGRKSSSAAEHLVDYLVDFTRETMN